MKSLLVSLFTLTIAAHAQFANYEAAQTRPVCLSPDGSRLFAVNTPDRRLSVFDVSNSANPVPVLIREIAVGLEPVSVNAVSNDEAWVVNEVGDSVSIVSVAQGITTTTLAAKDEPGDVVFAGGKAFVSCSRSNTIRVFDATTRAGVATIAIQGLHPRALAVSNDGLKIYAAVKFSGNRTTLLPASLAPPPPPPTNSGLLAAPQVSLIVSSNDARLSPQPNMPDNDVAEITVATNAVARYFKGAGTIHFAIAARPGTDEVWVTNTEARNLIRFEPVLKGHSVDNRVTRIATTPATGTVTPFDLNPTINYAAFPDTAGQAVALAQPTGIVFEPDGSHFWIAAFGSDRVARVNASTGSVVSRVETGPTSGIAADSRNKRGPRGLVIAGTRLFVLNRISNTITVVSTATGTVVAESPVGSFDPTPSVIRQGRGFLYDARLTGNGTQSCASCHIDGDRDDLAWDLGDPAGEMATVSQTVPGLGTQTFKFHPMKGPMTTQTLRGLTETEPLHWRADRAGFTAFNGAFESLLGGSVIPSADMTAFRDFISTVRYESNPNRNLDNTMPASFAGGNPNTGRTTYINDPYQPGLTCNTCHALPTGTNRLIISASALGESQDFKVPQLRNVYQKLNFFRSATTPSLSGFGLIHDGLTPDLVSFLTNPVFGTFQNDVTRKANLNAFVQCFDTGTAPMVGYSRTGSVAAMSADWTTLQSQAAVAGTGDLIVHGFVDGSRHTFRFRPATSDYASDEPGYGPFTRAQLEAKINAGAVLTILGVPSGTALRATDRDGDGTLDYAEPMPALAITGPSVPRLAWPSAESSLVLEFTDSLAPANWQPVLHPRTIGAAEVTVDDPIVAPARFYRLRRP